MVKDDFIWRYTPHIYTTLEYLLGKRGELVGTLGGCIESLEKWQVISRTFQEVKVPSGRTF
jgi:hypothetical protein